MGAFVGQLFAATFSAAWERVDQREFQCAFGLPMMCMLAVIDGMKLPPEVQGVYEKHGRKLHAGSLGTGRWSRVHLRKHAAFIPAR